MANLIRNDTELKKVMEAAVEKALEGVVKEVLEIFKRDYILEIAYIKDPRMYRRTWEFMEAWEFTDLKKDALTLSRELWYNWSTMSTFNIDAFIHGSKYSTPEDVRETLPEILEGKQSSLWISVNRDKKFWQEFIKDMFSGGELERIIRKHFSGVGFT